MVLKVNLFIQFEVFEDAFDKDDYNEFDPDALEDPLIKIDLLVKI